MELFLPYLKHFLLISRKKRSPRKPPKARFVDAEETSVETAVENAVSETDSLKRKLSDAEEKVNSLKKKKIIATVQAMVG